MIQQESFWHMGHEFHFYCFFADGAFYLSKDGWFALTNSVGDVEISERQTDFQEMQ